MNMLIWATSFFLHPFFVSVTEIQYNKVERSLEISIRIFTDDFENTLRMANPGKKVDFSLPETAAMDSLVSKYIRQKVQLVANDRAVPLQYVGFEKVAESVWCYFEVKTIDNLRKLHIHNGLLYEYKKEQINMHHVVNGSQRISRKLDNPTTDWEAVF